MTDASGDVARQLREALLMMSGALEPIREATEGYRAQLERDGYGDALARKMAADYHAALLRTVLK